MKFHPLPLAGAYMIELEPHVDERGFFSRSFCQREFADHGLPYMIRQSNISYNPKIGTLRGMHFQKYPHLEPKLVRCVKGLIYQVIVDLRPASETYCQYYSREVDSRDHCCMYVPPQFAHGFLTMSDEVEIHYDMFESYHPDYGSGFRYDDPVININWPNQPAIVSQQDQNWPPLDRTSLN